MHPLFGGILIIVLNFSSVTCAKDVHVFQNKTLHNPESKYNVNSVCKLFSNFFNIFPKSKVQNN